MVKIKSLLIALLIVIAGIGAILFFFPSEERKVKKQFALLSEYVAKGSGETTFTMAPKIKGISGLFAESCDFKVPVYSFSGSYTREEISGIALRGRAHFSSLDLKFHDLSISFPEKGTAKVTLTGRLTGKTTYEEYVDETRELECLLDKIEKRWLFRQFEVVEVLKK